MSNNVGKIKAMGKKILDITSLEAFLAEAKARADYRKDLEFIRDSYNLTQAEMAEQFGVSQVSISYWLRGEIKPKCLILIHLTAERVRKQLQK